MPEGLDLKTGNESNKLQDDLVAVGDGKKLLSGSSFLSEFKKKQEAVKKSTDWKEMTDLAQSHHFTVTLDRIDVTYNSGLGSSDAFLPVKNISFNPVKFNSMNIPTGIYGNFPLLRAKSVCEISLSLYDNDQDKIEKAIRNWEEDCFPSDKYVRYLSEIVGTLTYKSYSVKGKVNRTLKVSVIPADTISVTRGYGDNAAKMINLNLIAVGPVTISGS